MKKESKLARSLVWLALALLVAVPVTRGQTVATLNTLHAFSGSDGGDPQASLIQGSDGNFYGTTVGAMVTDGVVEGTAFEITPAGALTTLHQFAVAVVGNDAQASLIQGSDGNFYGTTGGGSTDSAAGTVFMLTSAGAFTTLYNFTDGSDGGFPGGGLIPGSDGTFYGTTRGGGTNGGGAVFEITPAGKLTTLYSFAALSSSNFRQSLPWIRLD